MPPYTSSQRSAIKDFADATGVKESTAVKVSAYSFHRCTRVWSNMILLPVGNQLRNIMAHGDHDLIQRRALPVR